MYALSTRSFYCQQKCGEVGFSIDEWNKSYLEIEAMPISEKEKEKLLFGEPCEIQCFDCIAIVGETRAKNKLIREMKIKTKKNN